MKAVVCTKYGPPEVLQVREVAKPVPKDKEILIRIHTASINYGDILVRNFRYTPVNKFNMPLPLWLPTRLMFGYFEPKQKILGSEFAGVIEATGKAVKKFKEGDPVFGYRGQLMGTHAEFLAMPEDGLVAIKPEAISFDEACTIPYGATTALNILKKARIQKMQKVLIIGASGSIGSAAVQFAKNYGADVSGVCGTPRIDFVKALGADKVFDYNKEDFTKNNETYDLIFDILGKSTFSGCKKSLNSQGIYLRASFKTRELFQMLWTSFYGNKKVICAVTPEKIENLIEVKALIEAGKIKSIIDKRFSMEQASEAHKYIEEGRKKGNVILAFSNSFKQ